MQSTVRGADASVVDSVLNAFFAIGRLMRQRVEGDGLEPGTLWLLKTLASQGPMRVTDLAGCSNLDTSTVSRHVSQLQKSGLIDRSPDPDDGRAQRVEPSAEGRRLLKESMDRRRTLLRRSLDGWDDTDIAQLDHLLARFVSDIESHDTTLENA